VIDLPRYPKPELLLHVPEYGHAILDAPAGTGKTETLEHLVVDLVLTQGLALGEILVLTATGRAAAALKRAIKEKLLELRGLRETTTRLSADQCWVLNDHARARIESALADFDSARIETVACFCDRVLVENPFLCGVPFRTERVSGRSLFAKAFRELLEDPSLGPEAKRYLTAWVAAGRSVLDLEELLFRASKVNCSPWQRADVEAIRKAARAFPDLDELEREVARLVPRVSLERVGRNLARLRSALEREDVELLLAELEGVELGLLGESLDSLLTPAKELDRLQVSLAAAIVPVLLPLIADRLRQSVFTCGRYDEDDAPLVIAEVLEGPRSRDLARILQSRYRAVLVDDFQDTDEAQWQILRKVFFDASGHHPLRLVADARAASGSVRGGDVGVYLRARKTVVPRSTVVPAVESFRATPDLVEALNLIFDPSAEHPFFDGPVRLERSLRAGRAELSLAGADASPRPPVVLLRAEGDDARRLLAIAIADEIRAILAEGDRRLFFGEKGKEKALGPGDIVVVTRTEREADEVARALEARGVRSAFFGRDGLFQSRQAEEVRDLLAAIASPEDHARRMRAWMTPFFGLSLGELETARHAGPGHPLTRRLAEWSLLAEKRAYEDLFPRILKESGVVSREIFRTGDGRGCAIYEQIFETLLEALRSSRPAPARLVRILESGIDGRGLSPGSGNLLRFDSEDAVRIAPAPGCKGLEAAVVFLYAFSAAPPAMIHAYRAKDARVGFVGDRRRASPEVRSAIEREELEEDQRLLYLALTRARARLYLPLVSEVLAKRGFYAQLHDRLQDLLDAFTIQTISSQAPPAEPAAIDLGGWNAPEELLGEHDSKELDAIRDRHRAPALTSFARTTAVAAREPSRFDSCLREVLLSVPFATLRESATLDAWSAREDVQSLFRRALRRNGVDRRMRAEAERLIHLTLLAPLRLGERRLDRGLASLSVHAREVEFLGRAEDGSGLVKGFVDLVFEHEGLVYFCDFKTETLSEPEWSAAATARHVARSFPLQPKLYRLAAIKMLKIETEEQYRSRFGGVVFCFLRGMPENGIHFERPSWSRREPSGVAR
jgi:exodeoxyribonuclease V beta subunit